MEAHSRSWQEVEEYGVRANETSPQGLIERKETSPTFSKRLQDLLTQALAVENIEWTFNTKDWAISVHAADIDSDGDIEILIGSRDGYIRALTSWGKTKWETHLEGHSISAVFGLSLSPLQCHSFEGLLQPCVFVGTRRGKILALNQNGRLEQSWEYATGRIIRQLYMSPNEPDHLIVGSEDRCVHILNRITGAKIAQYRTDGWVRCVFSYDLDGDGNDEIIAGSGDKHIYVLDHQGSLLHRFSADHQIYAIFATVLDSREQVDIITSSNRKDLAVWTLTRTAQEPEGEKIWRAEKKWEKLPSDGLFANRVHAIYAIDINQDQLPEILVGSEDGHLYILDHLGNVLWKHQFNSCVYSVHAADINRDGQVEILAATEDYGVHVLQIELPATNLYQAIKQAYRKRRETQSEAEIAHGLSKKERALLWDFVQPFPTFQRRPMELERGLLLLKQGEYKNALSIFLRLVQEKVQYYWNEPATVKGYIWSLCLGQLNGTARRNIVIGTDAGYIYAFDSEKNEDKQLWETNLGDRVRMVQTETTECKGYDSLVAVLANHRIVRLDEKGQLTNELVFENKQDWARCLYIHREEDAHGSTTNEILFGLENNRIAVCEADLTREITSISTPQGIGIVRAYHVTGNETADIISGSINNEVYVHHRNGELIWCFSTQDRVQALCVADIDKDGHAEVIVGSEDRNVYVLDYNGHLKWRYLAKRGIMDIDVCDIQMDFDTDEQEQRTLKVLVSSSDGFLYMLNAEGDLVWRYQSNNRIRCVRAADINGDGKVEIIIASENRLGILQIVDRKMLFAYIDECWHALLQQDEYRTSIIELIKDKDEFIHNFGLVKLAGLHQRHQEDFRRFREALKHEDSLLAKKELIRAIVVLCRVPDSHDENVYQARQFLQQLSTDPDPEVRLALVSILRPLLQTDEQLCFEYLEYFTHNIDPWVRRAVVRQCDALVTTYPERIFKMLLHMSQQEDHPWVLQEIGRVMAHYFDVFAKKLVADMLTILIKGSAPSLIRQISYSARKTAIRNFFDVLMQFLEDLSRENLGMLLQKGLMATQEVNALEPLGGEALLQTYENFYELYSAKTVSAIARHSPLLRLDDLYNADAPPTVRTILSVFAAFERVMEIARSYERREATGEQVTTLLQAIEVLDKTLNELRLEEVQLTRNLADKYRLPQYVILTLLLEQWHDILKAEMFHLRGTADLFVELKNKRMKEHNELDVALQIENRGRSLADCVTVRLEPAKQFEMAGEAELVVSEISTRRPATVHFKIRPRVSKLRLSFEITYADAEGKQKCIKYADSVTVKGRKRPFRHIDNPYTSGTPIRDNQNMFFGRKDDLAALKEKLSSKHTNKVVVLVGQRRMGKTSLIYHLAQELLQTDAYVPIFIDIQSQSLDTGVAQLLEGFAGRIQKELQKHRHVTLEEPVTRDFQTNPTIAFDRFLDQVSQALPASKVVLIFDEFEKLYDKVRQKQINEGLLSYLRSVMQHRRGFNFLLAGAPDIRNITEGYSSIFFNIGFYHNLKELKPEEAEALIKQPVEEYLDYDPLALERMHYLTGDQPYLIHVLSERLIDHCNHLQKSYVTINDINSALDTVLSEQRDSINWIWSQSGPLERFILSILAQARGEEGQVVSSNDIWHAFEAQDVCYSKEKVRAALDTLVRAGFIVEDGGGAQFKITVGLVKEWLRRDKPPQRVVREEQLECE